MLGVAVAPLWSQAKLCYHSDGTVAVEFAGDTCCEESVESFQSAEKPREANVASVRAAECCVDIPLVYANDLLRAPAHPSVPVLSMGPRLLMSPARTDRLLSLRGDHLVSSTQRARAPSLVGLRTVILLV
jgi:hypothetical protein